MDTRDKGNRCEALVAADLASHGHRIIARNYRCRLGELDIVSVSDGVLCVTEVKSLTSKWGLFGHPVHGKPRQAG